MNPKLHILHLEDRSTDAELAWRELRREGLDFAATRVVTEAEYLAGLREPKLDLILADYTLPSYDGLSALALAGRERPDVPFIFVSGNLGEEIAIAALHEGATDYVLKHRLGRLGAAVRRAIREVEERRQREQAEKAQREAEARFRLLFERSPDGIVMADAITGRFLEFNEEAHRQLGYTREEFARLTIPDIQASESHQEIQEHAERIKRDGSDSFETQHRTRQGGRREIHVIAQLLNVNGHPVFHSTWRDITKRKQAEETVRESEARYRKLFEEAAEGIALTDPQSGELLDCNKAFCRLTGYSREELIGKLLALLDPTAADASRETSALSSQGRANENGNGVHETQLLTQSGACKQVEIRANPIEINGRRVVQAIYLDVTAQRRLQQDHETTLKLLRLLNEKRQTKDLVRSLTGLIQEVTGCEAVGIRLQQGDDYPYFETRGFPPEFVQAENSLCQRDATGAVVRDAQCNVVLECMCGNVLAGRVNPTQSFFTPKGSFWTNSTSELLAASTEADRQGRTRNRCQGEGYESVGLFALRHGDRTYGLVQVNDRPKNRFTPELIELLEKIADQIALALAQRQTEADLRESEQNYREIFNSSHDAIFVHDIATGAILDANQTGVDLFGYSRTEFRALPGETFRDHDTFTHAEACRRIRQTATEGPQVFEWLSRKKNGERFWSEVRLRSVSLQGEKRVLAEVCDISDRKLAEEAIRAREAELECILSSTAEGIIAVDLQHTVIRFNRRFAEMWHLPPELLESRDNRFLLNFARDQLKDPKAFVESTIAFSQSEEVHMDTLAFRDGRFFERLSSPLKVGDQVVGTVRSYRDVTERKRVEGMLQLLREALESAANAIVITNRKGTILWANPALTDLTGYSPEEAVGQNPRILKSGRHDEAFYRRLWGTILTGHVWSAEMTNRRKDGSFYIEENTITPVLDETGQVTHFISVKQDVSARKQAELALRRSEEYFRALTEQAMDIVTVLSQDAKIRYQSASVRRLLGYAPGENVGRSAFELMHPDDRVSMQEVFAKSVRKPGAILHVEFRFRHRDGSWHVLEAIARNMIDDPNVCGVVVNSRDVTERKQLEERLRHVQKMEAIGTLAGGIAHDFNNILGAIMGNAALAKMDLTASHPAQEWVQAIEQAAQRAAELVRQILTFSRRQEAHREPITLQPLVKETVQLLRATIPASVKIHTEIAPDCPLALVDPTQIHQVLMNLCTNAYQALPERGGKLVIKLKGVENRFDLSTPHANLPPGRYLCLEVQDNGHGMDAATRARVFEPFYSTKPVGQGTGLGLSVVHGIVRNHEGAITVESQPGAGTTFRVYLPVYVAEVANEAEIAQSAPRGGAQRVLVVEDEVALGHVAERMLIHLGYRPTVAANALAALELVRAQPQLFDLVITDLNLPDVNGVDLSRQLLQIRPDVSMLLMSGYSGGFTSENVRELGFLGLLSKPFTMQTLGEAVHRALGLASEGEP